MTTNHHTPITTGAPANASTVNNPLGQLDSAITSLSAYDHEIVLSSADVFDVTLTSLPDFSGTKAVRIDFSLRTDLVDTYQIIYMLFNGDTNNANYNTQVNVTSNGVHVLDVSNAPRIAVVPAYSSPANRFGVGQIILNNLGESQTKVSTSHLGSQTTTTIFRTEQNTHFWANTNAITRIQIHPVVSTNKFVAGSFLRFKFIK